jgi:hypothetical protein
LPQALVDSRYEVKHVGPTWRTEGFLPWFQIAGGVTFEVRLISAQPVILELTGAWPKIGDEDAGVIAALAANDFAAGQRIDSAQPGVADQSTIDPPSLQRRIVGGSPV